MNRFLGTLLCLFFYAMVVDISFAMMHRGFSVVVAGPCPQGVFTGDGCPNPTAPTPGLFQQANAFQPGGYLNTVAATAQNYSGVRPPWNVACVDYGCGHYTPCDVTSQLCGSRTNVVCTRTILTFDGTCLLDPTTNPPAGCTAGTSGTGAPQVICGGSNAFLGTIQHYNFGPVNGHGCTALRVNADTVHLNTLLINDINWFNDSGLCANATGGGAPAFLFLQTQFAGGVTISNVILDGNSSVWNNKFGGTSPGSTPCDGATVQCNPWNAVSDDHNPMLYEYVVMKNFAASIISPPQGISGNQTVMRWSFIQTWCVRVPNCHAEWFDGQGNSGVGPAQITIDHTVITAEGSMFGNMQFGPAPMFLCANAFCPVGQYNFTNNVQVNPYIGGLTAQSSTYSGCVGKPPTGGTSASPTCAGGTGAILYVTQATVPIAHGLNVNCPAGGFGTYRRIPGPYTADSTFVTVIDEWSLDQQNGAYYPGFSATATCTNAVVSAAVANFAVETAHAITPLGAMHVTNNYFDVSSQGGGTTPAVFGNVGEPPTATFTGTITTTGGVSTVTITGSPATISLASPQEYITWTGQADACSASVLNCPRTVLGGTGSSFALTTVVPNIGPITMQGQYPSVCTIPPVWSGNIDMLGVATNLNGWSTNTNQIGCVSPASTSTTCTPTAAASGPATSALAGTVMFNCVVSPGGWAGTVAETDAALQVVNQSGSTFDLSLIANGIAQTYPSGSGTTTP